MTGVPVDETDDGSVRGLLAGLVGGLGEADSLTICEFSTAGIAIWDVRRDRRTGTPHYRCWPIVPWSSLYDDGLPSDLELSRIVRAEADSPTVLVLSSFNGLHAPPAFDRICTTYPDLPAFRYAEPLDELLRYVIARDPLTRWYKLVALRRRRSGRLDLSTYQLFPPGAQRGTLRPFVIRCEPADENGTVFAVVAADMAAEPSGRFYLVSVESVKLSPGSYALTAELHGPGMIRFHGLPGSLRADRRSWSDLVAAVPTQLEFRSPPQRSHPAHLICAVEVSGDSVVVASRLSRVEQLIQCVADDVKEHLLVSLISYGPHSFDIGTADVPVALTWALTSSEALSKLDQLRDSGTVGIGYPRAAQIECVLTLLAERLDEQKGRPVVVTVGGRPAFPHQLDPLTEILPCPHRHNWRRALHRLRETPGIAFGAIQDHGQAAEEIWAGLGKEAFARLEVMDVMGFAANLGLLSSTVQYVPFPLIDAEGAERAAK